MPPLEVPAALARLAGRHFLSTGDLTPAELHALLDFALAGKRAGRGAFGTPLAGRGVGLVFFNPSLRTRVSMTMATYGLGGQPVPLEIGAGTWDLEHEDGVVMNGAKAEHVKEAVPVLGQYVDALGVRCFPGLKDLAADRLDPVLRAFARHAPVPVINLESALYHPCQALADMLTIKERLGAFAGRKATLIWANHPKALPHAVPNSFALAALQCGLELTIAAPSEYLPDDGWMATLKDAAGAGGGKLSLTTDREAAYDGAQVIYAKSWASPRHYGDAAKEASLRASLGDWIVTEARMRRTRDGVFMHCLPVRRGVVVTDGVLDGPWSVVVEEAANRLHAQTALLAALMPRRQDGGA